jgi:hypothetical protein
VIRRGISAARKGGDGYPRYCSGTEGVRTKGHRERREETHRVTIYRPRDFSRHASFAKVMVSRISDGARRSLLAERNHRAPGGDGADLRGRESCIRLPPPSDCPRSRACHLPIKSTLSLISSVRRSKLNLQVVALQDGAGRYVQLATNQIIGDHNILAATQAQGECRLVLPQHIPRDA